MPLRSRVGNKAACILFRAAGGPAGVTDTQTGLRAFGYPMLDSLLAIGGDGYEYEMNVLLHCRRRGIPIQEVPIRTLCLDEQNSSSHFHPLRDSWKVVKTMLRFASASLASFALDYGLFMILHGLTRGFGGGLLFSNVAARLGSGAFNYLLNRRLVFHDQGDPRRSLAGYLLLAAGILLGIYYFHYLRPYRFELPASSPPAAQAAPAPSSSRPADASGSGAVQAPGTMGAKFASQFSDTVVSTRDTYRSKDLAVTVTSHVLKKSGDKDTRYYVADVYTSNIDCFKTYFAQNTYGSGFTEKITDMSADVGAVLAMNGDSYCYNHQHPAGSLIRNGVVYRAEPTSSDVCILYRDGVMRTYSPGQFDLKQAVRGGAYQSWTFGPRLLDDQGRAMTEFNTWDYIRESHPRSAVGYYEPGHYCFLVADGRSAQSSGMTLQEMSLVFEKLGCAAAYNLDGGHSAFLAFQGQVVNHPYRSSHQITDCLYFGEVP